MEQRISHEQKQGLALAPRQLQGLKLLAKSLPELRAEIIAQISANPAIEDIDHPLETPLSEIEARHDEDAAYPDYPEDDYLPGASADEDAAERRQAFFDKQVKQETLQEHLIAQFPVSNIDNRDFALAEVLVGDIDGNGRYKGSLPDACMSFGKTPAEVKGVLAKIMELDPAGCGAMTPQECLLAQMDKIADAHTRDIVDRMIRSHFSDVAAGKFAEVMSSLGISRDEYVAALKELRTLEAYPGRQYPDEHDRVEYVNPEVHAVKRDGYWYAVTDKRSLPEVRLSKQFLENMRRENLTAEEKDRMRKYVEDARQLSEAIAERRNTVEVVSQAIFDRQQEYFSKGKSALKPLTEREIAEEVGVAAPTVSRTVCDKYASTPFGTMELRKFFVSGVVNAEGESVSQDNVLDALKKIIDAEDKGSPLSDEKIAEKLAEMKLPAARRTVAKYRAKLSIPGAAERKNAGTPLRDD